MKFLNLLIVTLLFSPKLAFGGAVSAGGMQLPASLECLFNDPRDAVAPLNLKIYEYNHQPIEGTLQKYNLKTNDSILMLNYGDIKIQSNGFSRYIHLSNNDSKLIVTINYSIPVSNDQFFSFFEPLFNIPGTILFDGVEKIIGHMSFKGKSFKGVCADKDFISYGSL